VPLAFLQAIGQINLVGTSIGGVETILPNFGFSAENLLPTLTTLFAMVGGTMFASSSSSRKDSDE
jgi:preprotein translocase subunit SecY